MRAMAKDTTKMSELKIMPTLLMASGIPAQSDQCPIFSLQIQRDRRNVQTALNSRLVIIIIVLHLYTM